MPLVYTRVLPVYTFSIFYLFSLWPFRLSLTLYWHKSSWFTIDTNKQLTVSFCTQFQTLVFEIKNKPYFVVLWGFYIIKRKLHGRLEMRNFSSRVEKYFTRSLCSLVKYFSTLEEKFRISARPCNILYIYVVFVSRGEKWQSAFKKYKRPRKITKL